MSSDSTATFPWERAVPTEAAPPPASAWRSKAIFVAIALLVVHLVIGSDRYVWWQRALGALPGMLAGYTGIRYLIRRQFDHLPFIEYAFLHWYIFLGMPTITSSESRIPVSDDALTAALLALALMTVCAGVTYLIGNWVGRRFRRPVSAFLPGLPSDIVNIVFWPWLLVTAALNTGLINRLPDALHYPATILGSYYPILALEALRVHGEKHASPRRLLIATAVLCAAGLFSGLMSRVLTPLLTTGVLHTLLRGRVPRRLVAMFFALIVVLQPAKLIYRQIAWEDKGVAGGSISDSFERWVDALTQAWLGDSSNSGFDRNVDLLAHRFDALSSSAACFELVPGVIPFDDGKMWKYLFTAPIPRALYPDKPNPTVIYNDRYNITFGLQSEEATSRATFAFPLTADGYWNFGWGGVVFVGIVMGLLLGLCAGALEVWRWGPLSLALSMFVDARFHSHLGAQIGGVLQTLLGTAIVCWAVWLITYSRTRHMRT